MATKGGGDTVTATSYKKLDSVSENGIINEVLIENDENFHEVFKERDDFSPTESESECGTLERNPNNRKRSILSKKTSDGRPRPTLQKRVSFSSVGSESRRRVSSGKPQLIIATSYTMILWFFLSLCC